MDSYDHLRELSAISTAVLIPCYNEESSIAKVVNDFRKTLPTAIIYVCDNNSTDRTAQMAQTAGAIVLVEELQGKGNVVRRMFADIEADVYVLVDGDDTYDAASAPDFIGHLLSKSLDMVNGARITDAEGAYRPGHRLGNVVLTRIAGLVFGNRLRDMLSGYRVLSRRFVKSFPVLTHGFEIETELTIHALELGMPILELQTPYRERPPNSTSKLRTFRDGLRILGTILVLVKVERPSQFFAAIFALFAGVAIILAWPLMITYLRTGLVPRFPTAILSTGLMILAFLSLVSGLILDTVTRGRREIKRLHYLSIPGPSRFWAFKETVRMWDNHSVEEEPTGGATPLRDM